MNILELLSSNSYLTVNKALAKKVGLEAAVLFADLAGSQLHWNNQKEIEVSDWFFRTREQIEEQTTLSPKTQLRCAKILIESGLIQTKLKGLPAVTHYLIGEQEVTNLLNMIGKKGAARYAQTEQLETPKRSAIKNINNNNKTINNININKESKNGFTIIYPTDFSLDLIKTLNEFFDYKKEIKKPLKSVKSLKALFNKIRTDIEQYGEKTVIDSLYFGIANGWQGYYIKTNLNNNQKQNQNGIRTQQSEQEIRQRSVTNIYQNALNAINEEERRTNDLIKSLLNNSKP